MRVYLQPPAGLSRAMDRVSQALAWHAPYGTTEVKREEEAELVVLHVIGSGYAEEAVARLRARGQRYAIMQYCLRSVSERPNTRDWLGLWSGAEAVWSYYDLPALMREDGLQPDEHDIRFYIAPLGVDHAVFLPPTAPAARPYVILTSGYVAETEGVREASRAALRARRKTIHLGPDLGLGRHVHTVLGVSDGALAGFYGQCEYVAGLRRCEGFELPAAEGLLCGARPIVFDRPHYRQWFDGLAEFIEEGSEAAVEDALADLFAVRARPVTETERDEAVRRFDWERLVQGFWLEIGVAA